MPIRREAAKFFYTLFYTFRRKTKNRVLHHFFPLFLAAQLEHFQFYTTFSRFFWPRNWKNRVLHHFFPLFWRILPRSGNAFSIIFPPLFLLEKTKNPPFFGGFFFHHEKILKKNTGGGLHLSSQFRRIILLIPRYTP